jgi:hypothetical protein
MALDELAATAFYVHDYKTGLAACEVLLKQNRLPETEIERNQKNHAAYLEKVQQLEGAQRQMHIPQVPVVAAQTVLNTPKKHQFKKRRK